MKINPSEQLLDSLKERLGLPEATPDSKVVTGGLKAALAANMTPIACHAVNKDPSNHRLFHVNPVIKRKLTTLLTEHKKLDAKASMATVGMGMLCSYVQGEKITTKTKTIEHEFEKWLKKAGYSQRAEQSRLIRECLTHLDAEQKPYIMAEASVGVGKSLALASIAIHHLSKHRLNGSIVICAPTYQIATQLNQAFEELNSASGNNYSSQLVRSKSEFISADQALYHLENNCEDVDPDIVDRCLKLLQSGIYYRTDYEIAGLNTSTLKLNLHLDPNDEAQQAYYAERAATRKSDVVVCTHAMLAAHIAMSRGQILQSKPDIKEESDFKLANQVIASDIKKLQESEIEPRLLPKIGLLLVDEAHAIAETYQSIRQQKISLAALRKHVSKAEHEKLLSKNNSADANAIINDFIEQLKSSSTGKVKRRHTSQFFDRLAPLVKLRKKDRTTVTGLLLQESMSNLQNLIYSPDFNHRIYSSPILGAVSISNSPGIPIDWLDLTWRLSEKVVMLSGTLQFSEMDSGYHLIGSKLAMPVDKIAAINPIETSWLRENVTVYRPEQVSDKNRLTSENAATLFSVPERENKKAFSEWVDLQGQYIAQNFASRPGGAIVLCTSYDQIIHLSKRLKTELKNQTDIVVISSREGESLSATKDKYVESYSQGKRPLWVAIPAVSTGVDITDANSIASEDHMISTLYLTRIPFMPSNKKKNSFLSQNRDALLIIKQFFGRLVRRPGRQNMEIHILDARMSIKKGVYRIHSSLLAKYQVKDIETTNLKS